MLGLVPGIMPVSSWDVGVQGGAPSPRCIGGGHRGDEGGGARGPPEGEMERERARAWEEQQGVNRITVSDRMLPCLCMCACEERV